MEVRSGYKRTEVGVIPEEWGIVEVSNLISYGPRNGYSGRSGKNARGTPTLALTATSSGRMILNEETVKFLEEALDPNSEILLKTGDVLVQRSNTLELVGTTAIFNGPSDIYAYPDLMVRLRFNSPETSQWFWRFANSSAGRRYFTSVAAGSTGTMPKLSGGKIRSMPIPLPSQFEQQAIATALSDVDALLAGLDRLIAKKRDLKQAAMQQLITGQTRLPGFRGEWEVKRIENLCTLKSGEGITAKSIDNSSDFPCYGGNGLRGFTNRFTHEGNYCLIGRVGALCGNLLNVSGKFFASEHAIVVTACENTDIGWLTLALGTLRLNRRAESSAQPVLTVSKLYSLEIFSPPTKAEQAAIASVLMDMDEELVALEKRRDKTRALKQAMMQELLTGRIRLVNPDAAADVESPVPKNNRQANVHFTRSVLAAEIIDRLHDQPTFGHVKFEKILFLVERLCDVDTGSTYHRQAAGPYDNRALRSIDSQLQKQQWFEARKEGQRYHYLPMKNRGGHKRYFERYFSGLGNTFEKILENFKTQDTERCEIVATLLAAWDDLLQGPEPVSDDRIVNEVLNNWHDSKKRISEERWQKALAWMRKEGFVPRSAMMQPAAANRT